MRRRKRPSSAFSGCDLMNWRCPSIMLGLPPCGRAYFFLLRQEKVAKKKATPGAAPFGFLPLLGKRGGCATRATPSNSARPLSASACVAQRLPWGPKSVSAPPIAPKKSTSTVNPKKGQKTENPSASDVFPGPLRGAEQRREAGGSRRGLSEGRRPEFRSRPVFRVAQGTPEGGTDPGSPFLCLLSFGEAKESKARLKRENQQ